MWFNALHVRDSPNVFVNVPSGDCIHWNGLERDVLILGIVEKEDFFYRYLFQRTSEIVSWKSLKIMEFCQFWKVEILWSFKVEIETQSF